MSTVGWYLGGVASGIILALLFVQAWHTRPRDYAHPERGRVCDDDGDWTRE